MRDDFYIAWDNYIQVKSSESELSLYILTKVEELPDYILDYLNLIKEIVLKSEYLIKISNDVNRKFVYMKGYTLYLDIGYLCLEKKDNEDKEEEGYYRLSEKERHRLINKILQFNGRRI